MKKFLNKKTELRHLKDKLPLKKVDTVILIWTIYQNKKIIVHLNQEEQGTNLRDESDQRGILSKKLKNSIIDQIKVSI